VTQLNKFHSDKGKLAPNWITWLFEDYGQRPWTCKIITTLWENLAANIALLTYTLL